MNRITGIIFIICFVKVSLFAQKAGDTSTLESRLNGVQKDSAEYRNLVHPVEKEMDLLHKKSLSETDNKMKDSLHLLSETYSAKLQTLTYRFFVSHPGSYYAESLFQFYLPMYDLDSIKKVYNGLVPALKENEMGKDIAKKIKAMEAGSPGRIAQNFTTSDIDGKSLSLSSFKGKYVILDFWASWCVPCRKSHPHLRSIYAKYKDKGLEIIGIASDEQHPDWWKAAVAKDSIGNWHQVLGGEDMAKRMKGLENPADIGAKYGISALPTKLIIDPSGKIIARWVGDGEGNVAGGIDSTLAAIYDGQTGGQYGAYLSNLQKAIGALAPDFTQNDPDGKPVHLADFRGKYVLVDFWASWCHPCRAENPAVVKAYEAFRNKNFTIISVSLDKSKKDWIEAINKDGLSWTNVSDLKYWNNEVAKLYEVQGVPTNFLIDPSGRIVATNLRGEELNKKLAELL